MDKNILIEFIDATENDLYKVLEIYNFYIVNTAVTFDADKISIEELKNRVFIHHNRYKTYLIYCDGDIAGFCFLTQYRKKPAYDKTAELGLYLMPQFTGKGLGQQIVTHIESIAKGNQLENIIASISGENVASIKLFRKLGYEQCAHYKEIAVKFGRKMDIIDFQKKV